MTSPLLNLPKDILNEILVNLQGEDIVNLMTTSKPILSHVLPETYDYLQYVKISARPAEQRSVDEIKKCIEDTRKNASDIIVVDTKTADLLNIPDYMKTKSERLLNTYYIYSKRAFLLWIKIYALLNSLVQPNMTILIDETLGMIFWPVQNSVLTMDEIERFADDLASYLQFFSVSSDPITRLKQYQFLCQEYSDLKALYEQLNSV